MEHKFCIYQLFIRLFGNTCEQPHFYGDKKQNGCGTLDDINTKAIRAIKNLGCTHIWLTGVLEHATLTAYPELGIAADNPWIVKGKAGSPYAIKDYFDIAPDLARQPAKRMQTFEKTVKRIQKEGLKVLIDFVANHVSRQYKSDTEEGMRYQLGLHDDTSVHFSPANNFYYLPNQHFEIPDGVTLPPGFEQAEPYVEYPAKVTGNDCFKAKPHLYDWYETVKLNFGIDYEHGCQAYFDPIPATWHQMLAVLQFWAQKGVDGFRCDMVELVPAEFWGWAIAQVKAQYPHIIFIAEVYNPQRYQEYLYKGRFDYLYDKVGLYDELKLLLEGKGNANHLSKVWQQQEGYSHRMLRFTENHDEVRIASTHLAGDAFKGIPAMVLCACMGTGPFMIYNGQEVGETGDEASGFSGPDGKTTIFDYWHMPILQKWVNNGHFDGKLLPDAAKRLRATYAQISHFALSSEAIKHGKFYDLQFANRQKSYDYNDWRTYAFLRFTENEYLLIVCHFEAHHRHHARVKIPHHALQMMNLHQTTQLELIEMLHGEQKITVSTHGICNDDDIWSGVPITMAPWQAYIFKIIPH